jgi:hypothetical protein
MTPLDILYTPLDVPDLPENFNVEKLETWIKNVYPQKQVNEAVWTSVKVLGETYPWDLTFAHYTDNKNNSYGWLNNFDKEFPELVDYFLKAFNLDYDDIGVITFLPMRQEKTGLGFWHSDIDETGLRIYFDNELPEENPLLIMPTNIPFIKRPHELLKAVEEPRKDMFQVDKQLVCPVLKRTQAYYINNVRAVHSPYINKPCRRISCFITPKWNTLESVKNKTKDLIVQSAIKFKNHAILWSGPDE